MMYVIAIAEYLGQFTIGHFKPVVALGHAWGTGQSATHDHMYYYI
ncbi:hypothetical protein [Vibrio nomapromontoriensis]